MKFETKIKENKKKRERREGEVERKKRKISNEKEFRKYFEKKGFDFDNRLCPLIQKRKEQVGEKEDWKWEYNWVKKEEWDRDRESDRDRDRESDSNKEKIFEEEKEKNEENCNMNEKDESGLTLLQYLCKNYVEEKEFLEYLFLTRECDFNQLSHFNKTAFYYLLEREANYELIQLILEKNEIDFDFVDENDNSYLHLISKKKKYFHSIPFFVELKCDLNLKNKFDETPLHHLFYNQPDFQIYKGESLQDLYKSIFFCCVFCGFDFESKNANNISCRNLIEKNDQISSFFLNLYDQKKLWKSEFFEFFPSFFKKRILSFLLSIKISTRLLSIKIVKYILQFILFHFVNYSIEFSKKSK